MPSALPTDEELTRRLPLPLAQLHRRAHNAKTPLERHQAAYYLWEAALELLGSVAVVEYGRLGERDARTAERLQNLARPAVGHWWEFVRLLLPTLADAEPEPFAALHDLLLGRALNDLPHVAELDSALREELDGKGEPRPTVRLSGLFDRLVRYRNKRVGHGALGNRPTKYYDRLGRLLLAGVAELLGRLDVLAGRRLLYISDVRREASGGWLTEGYELIGETARRVEMRSAGGSGGALACPERVYLEKPAGGQETEAAPVLCALHPLVIYDEERRKVFFLNAQRQGQRAEYLDYVDDTGLDRDDLASELQEFMARLLGTAAEQPVPPPTGSSRRPPTAEPEPAAPPDAPAVATPPEPVEAAPARPAPGGLRLAILYKRHAQPDEQLLHRLEKDFGGRGHEVFVDRHMAIGVEWAKELERRVRSADAIVMLLSAASVQSEMLAWEVQIAADEARKRGGKPLLLPVRIDFEGKLPQELASILDPLQYFLWRGPADDGRLVAELIQAARNPRDPLTKKVPPPTGVLPLDTQFYVERPTDREFLDAVRRQDSIVRIRGARQVGKTSLLARGLKEARAGGARVLVTDFQKLNASDLESADQLFRALGEWIADQLDLDVSPDKSWNPRRGPSVNFEKYMLKEVMARVEAPLVWAMDEVDRLFTYGYRSEVFGLFRSWHNARMTEPTLPWARLTLAIAYATEAHLFIEDMNQSPFNVGTLLVLEDFTLEQVGDLNRRYGGPLHSDDELRRYHQLVGGQPYLVNRGLYEMVQRGLDVAAFEAQAAREDGVFGDHLRRMLVLLARDPQLSEVVRGVLRGQPCPTTESFYRLRSAGVMAGDSARDVRPRCRLYAIYLERHLS